jgi:hypothetical protein
MTKINLALLKTCLKIYFSETIEIDIAEILLKVALNTIKQNLFFLSFPEEVDISNF